MEASLDIRSASKKTVALTVLGLSYVSFAAVNTYQNTQDGDNFFIAAAEGVVVDTPQQMWNIGASAVDATSETIKIFWDGINVGWDTFWEDYNARQQDAGELNFNNTSSALASSAIVQLTTNSKNI